MVLEADALRALGRFAEAADTYAQASEQLPPPEGTLAGFLAAQTYHRDLDQQYRALDVLNTARVDGETSPLRERALLLRARILVRLGRSPAEVARRYLTDYPNSAAADIMRGYIKDTGSTETAF